MVVGSIWWLGDHWRSVGNKDPRLLAGMLVSLVSCGGRKEAARGRFAGVAGKQLEAVE